MKSSHYAQQALEARQYLAMSDSELSTVFGMSARKARAMLRSELSLLTLNADISAMNEERKDTK